MNGFRGRAPTRALRRDAPKQSGMTRLHVLEPVPLEGSGHSNHPGYRRRACVHRFGRHAPGNLPAFTTATPARGRWAARGKARVGLLAALLLACACSRPPERPGAAPQQASGTVPSPPGTAAAHLARAEDARTRADFARAKEEYESARALFEKDGKWERSIHAWIGLSAMTQRLGHDAAAAEHLGAALAAAREKLGPGHVEVASALDELGTVHVATGRTREALELFGQALEIRRATNSPPEDTAET